MLLYITNKNYRYVTNKNYRHVTKRIILYISGGGHVRSVQFLFNVNETARVRSSGRAPTLVTMT